MITDQNILSRLILARTPKAKKLPALIAKRSDTLKEVYKGYKVQVKIFLSKPDNHRCRIQMACSGAVADCVHHVAGRTGSKLRDESDWMPACSKCNLWCEEHDAEARVKGFKKTRMGKVNKS